MSKRPPASAAHRRRLATAAIGMVGVAAAITACTSANGVTGATSAGTAGGSSSTSASATASAAAKPKPPALKVVSVSPAAGSKVSTDAVVTVRLSTALASGHPTISPKVAGTWTHTSATTLTFTPSAPLPATTRFTVTVPAGLTSTRGVKLAHASTTTFTTKKVATARVQQLLAELGYLPLSFHVTGTKHTGHTIATTETGTFTWRWASARSLLSAYWSVGTANTVTRSAIMDFQRQHGLVSDGVAGRVTAAALVKDALAGKKDKDTYDYVHVSKTGSESSTVYVDGAVKFHVPVSTGITGATTFDGLFPVYRHAYFVIMRGTDVDGTKYVDPIYWASYFNGGEAMHAYPRASYGFPQSNGCVEMYPPTAKLVYPYTPIGTPVLVTG